MLTVFEASQLATELIGRPISQSNISYLVQYGQLKRYNSTGQIFVSKDDVREYYNGQVLSREERWKKQLGNDLNWALSFDGVPEKIRTKHVHRLHPYKGKFIPQLVEYFLDEHTDMFKQEIYFQPGDIILDPFCGSGTTLVQAAEQGIDAIGIDVSAFNSMISNVKISNHDISRLAIEINSLTKKLKAFVAGKPYLDFEENLLAELNNFNSAFFSMPDYRFNVRKGIINEELYSRAKEKEFLDLYNNLIKKHGVEIIHQGLGNNSFLDKWFNLPVIGEINFMFSQIKRIENQDIKNVLAIILSRTMRSCRATTHNDLATLLEPVHTTYYCRKHYKICKPIFSILGWWIRYSSDTLKRLNEFRQFKKDSFQHCFVGDSRSLDLDEMVRLYNSSFYKKFKNQRVKGIFTSPPYVGLIDYHEQHAYAYDLFKFERHDEEEIGPLFRGQNKEAQDSYAEGIAAVLINCKNYLVKDFDVFLVANDKFGLYPRIAELANMNIVNVFRRPVLNRTEKNKVPYSESIFHLRRKNGN